MKIAMIRIDDRLIHGQVVVGWCPEIRPDRLILCDDEVAQSEWDREIYEDAASIYQTTICNVAETVQLIQSEEFIDERVFVIIGSPAVAVQLLNAGVALKKIIVGGMHFQPGKRKVADFIYVDDDDISHLKYLVRNDVAILGQDVPNCKPIDLASKLQIN